MKKYFLVVVCALLLFVVTGCNNNKNKVVCSGSFSEDGLEMEAEIAAELDSADKVTAINVTYDLKDKDTAKQYCVLFQLMQDSEKGITVECSGSKIIIKGLTGLDDDEENEEDKIVGKTKADFVNAAEAEGLTCK